MKEHFRTCNICKTLCEGGREAQPPDSDILSLSVSASECAVYKQLQPSEQNPLEEKPFIQISSLIYVPILHYHYQMQVNVVIILIFSFNNLNLNGNYKLICCQAKYTNF